MLKVKLSSPDKDTKLKHTKMYQYFYDRYLFSSLSVKHAEDRMQPNFS